MGAPLSLRTLPLLVATLGVLTPGVALAYPYTPWNGATGGGVFAVNPYISYGDDTLSVTPYVVAGVSDRFELVAGAPMDFPRPGSGESVVGVELLPRVILSEAFIVAPYLFVGQGGSAVGLELHGTTAGGGWMFSHNTGVHVDTVTGSADYFTILAPEREIRTGTWLFVEVNPTLTIDGATTTGALEIVPGITVALDEEADHLITVAAPTSVLDGLSPGLGLCYWGAFSRARDAQ